MIGDLKEFHKLATDHEIGENEILKPMTKVKTHIA